MSGSVLIYAEPQFMSGSGIIYAKAQLMFDRRIMYVGPKCMSDIIIICLDPSVCLTLPQSMLNPGTLSQGVSYCMLNPI